MSFKSLVLTLFLSFCITSLLTAQNSTYSKTQVLPDEHWTPANTGTNGLSSFDINGGFIDSKDRYYFFAEGESGYTIIDRLSGSNWDHFNPKQELKTSVTSFLETAEGDFWTSTRRGLFLLSDNFVIKDSVVVTENDTLSKIFGSVVEDENGMLWASHPKISDSYRDPATFERINYLIKKGGITVIDPSTSEIIARIDTMNSGLEKSIAFGGISSMTSSGEKLYFGVRPTDTTAGGIAVYSASFDTAYSYQLSNSTIPSEEIGSMLIDKDGKLWVTFNDGDIKIAYLDGEDWIGFDSNSSPVTERCKNITTGTDNKIYCTTNTSLLVYSDDNWTAMPDSIENRAFTDINYVASNNDGVEIFFPDGPGVFIRKNDSWEYLSSHTDGGLFSTVILSLEIDSNNGIWAGGFEGVSYFDGINWTYYNKENGLPEDYVWRTYTATDGRVWFGVSGGGITYYENSEFTTINDYGSFEECIFEDNNQNIWIGSYNRNGILQYDGASFTHHDTLDGIIDREITSIAQGPDDFIYAGSRYGAAYFDGEHWISWTPDSTEEIKFTEIASDQDQNIWMIGDSLMKWDGEVLSQYAYPEDHELINASHIEPDPNGNIWFVSGYYVYIFNTSSQMWAYHHINEVPYIITHGATGISLVGAYKGGIYKFNTMNALPIEEPDTSPTQFSLDQNYPNPFNPSTTIGFTLAESVNDLSITVYDLVGRKVATLLEKNAYSAGYHSINFEASGLASGMYLYRIESSKFTSSKKMMLIK